MHGRLGNVGEVQQVLLKHERQRDGGDKARTRRWTGGLGLSHFQVHSRGRQDSWHVPSRARCWVWSQSFQPEPTTDISWALLSCYFLSSQVPICVPRNPRPPLAFSFVQELPGSIRKKENGGVRAQGRFPVWFYVPEASEATTNNC